MLTEKGLVKTELDRRLASQLNRNLADILHAVNSYSLDGITDELLVKDQKEAIFKHITNEIDELDGIEAVYTALLNRQTFTTLENMQQAEVS